MTMLPSSEVPYNPQHLPTLGSGMDNAQALSGKLNLGLKETPKLSNSWAREDKNFLPNSKSEHIRPWTRTLVIDYNYCSRYFDMQRLNTIASSYEERIAYLREQAENDGLSLNAESVIAFRQFYKRNPFIKRGHFTLVENGNLRAVWEGPDGIHIGLQFLEDHMVQFVIFVRRKLPSPVSRSYGRDTVDGIEALIDAYGLREVIYI